MSPTRSIGLGHYLVTWAALMALGVLSYGLVFVSLPPPWGIVVALIIAGIKALLVALVFMHLLQHHGSVRLVAAFGAAFVVLLVLLMVVDVQNRTGALSPGHEKARDPGTAVHGHTPSGSVISGSVVRR